MKRQKGQKKTAYLLVLCFIASLLTGCGEKAESAETVKKANQPYAAVVSMEDTPIVDYIVPQLTPNILINRYGYLAGGEKVAAVKSSRNPEDFRLVDAETDVVVYRGKFEKVTCDEETGVYKGNADFSQYVTGGSYYLETDYIGRSHTFTIEDNLYDKLFEELYQSLVADCKEMKISTLESVTLLMAYEWYPEIFADTDKDEVPDVLAILRQWISGKLDDKTSEEEVLFAAFLAKYSYLYQKYDKAYATDCLRQATAIYDKSQKNIHKDAQSFLALTELYRATGTYAYRKQILDYKDYLDNGSSFFEEQEYLFGAMTYVVTRQKVDIDLCESLMSKVMGRGEEISEIYMDMISATDAKNNGCDDILKKASQLSCANYVLNNYKYNRIMEELTDYLMGKNVKSVCFYPDEGIRTGYICLLAQLAAVHRDT